MEPNQTQFSPEEMRQMLEKANREAAAALAKLSPEERARAQEQARKQMEEDAASRQRILDAAAAVAAGNLPRRDPAPKFCPHCGAPVSGGNFCEYCGSPL